jgi:hypothetical protein
MTDDISKEENCTMQIHFTNESSARVVDHRNSKNVYQRLKEDLGSHRTKRYLIQLLNVSIVKTPCAASSPVASRLYRVLDIDAHSPEGLRLWVNTFKSLLAWLKRGVDASRTPATPILPQSTLMFMDIPADFASKRSIGKSDPMVTESGSWDDMSEKRLPPLFSDTQSELLFVPSPGPRFQSSSVDAMGTYQYAQSPIGSPTISLLPSSVPRWNPLTEGAILALPKQRNLNRQSIESHNFRQFHPTPPSSPRVGVSSLKNSRSIDEFRPPQHPSDQSSISSITTSLYPKDPSLVGTSSRQISSFGTQVSLESLSLKSVSSVCLSSLGFSSEPPAFMNESMDTRLTPYQSRETQLTPRDNHNFSRMMPPEIESLVAALEATECIVRPRGSVCLMKRTSLASTILEEDEDLVQPNHRRSFLNVGYSNNVILRKNSQASMQFDHMLVDLDQFIERLTPQVSPSPPPVPSKYPLPSPVALQGD